MLGNFFNKLKSMYGGQPDNFEGHYGIEGQPLSEGGDTPPTGEDSGGPNPILLAGLRGLSGNPEQEQ
jgi:hypothetical protein